VRADGSSTKKAWITGSRMVVLKPDPAEDRRWKGLQQDYTKLLQRVREYKSKRESVGFFKEFDVVESNISILSKEVNEKQSDEPGRRVARESYQRKLEELRKEFTKSCHSMCRLLGSSNCSCSGCNLRTLVSDPTKLARAQRDIADKAAFFDLNHKVFTIRDEDGTIPYNRSTIQAQPQNFWGPPGAERILKRQIMLRRAERRRNDKAD